MAIPEFTSLFPCSSFERLRKPLPVRFSPTSILQGDTHVESGRLSPFEYGGNSYRVLPAVNAAGKPEGFLLMSREQGQIGQGSSKKAFAAVHVCQPAEGSGVQIRVQSVLTSTRVDSLKTEYHVLGEFAQHQAQNLAPATHGFYASVGDNIGFLSQDCMLGTLADLIQWLRGKASSLDEYQKQEWIDALMRSLLLSLSALHESGFAHGDLKPDNIYITQEFKIVFGDLLTSSHVKTQQEHERIDGVRYAYLKASAGYDAPESGRIPKSQYAGDVWALGGILDSLCSALYKKQIPASPMDLHKVVERVTGKPFEYGDFYYVLLDVRACLFGYFVQKSKSVAHENNQELFKLLLTEAEQKHFHDLFYEDVQKMNDVWHIITGLCREYGLNADQQECVMDVLSFNFASYLGAIARISPSYLSFLCDVAWQPMATKRHLPDIFGQTFFQTLTTFSYSSGVEEFVQHRRDMLKAKLEEAGLSHDVGIKLHQQLHRMFASMGRCSTTASRASSESAHVSMGSSLSVSSPAYPEARGAWLRWMQGKQDVRSAFRRTAATCSDVTVIPEIITDDCNEVFI